MSQSKLPSIDFVSQETDAPSSLMFMDPVHEENALVDDDLYIPSLVSICYWCGQE